MTSQNGFSQSFDGRGGFGFTGAAFDKLDATDYTLVTIAVDVTGSVSGFKDDLLAMLKQAIKACKRAPRSDNILVRLITFATTFAGGINEIHGFKPLADIDEDAYAGFSTGGLTPLYNATFAALVATNDYAQKLADQDFGVNAIVFIITDGGDNASQVTAKMVADEQRKAVTSEKLESIITVLIGVNVQFSRPELEEFKKDAELTQYVDVADASPANLAKLAAFVSQSVSSQSQALGTGGPSQNIAATI